MSLALAASFAISPTTTATKKVLGESRPECHRVVQVNYPDSRHGFRKRAVQLGALSNQSAGPVHRPSWSKLLSSSHGSSSRPITFRRRQVWDWRQAPGEWICGKSSLRMWDYGPIQAHPCRSSFFSVAIGIGSSGSTFPTTFHFCHCRK